MDRVRAEFTTKEAHSDLVIEHRAVANIVRRLDKSIYAALAIFGFIVLFGRIAARYLFE
jgi:hypothetical protein